MNEIVCLREINMAFIDDLYKVNDPQNIAAKEAAKNAEFLDERASDIANAAKTCIERTFRTHHFSGYYRGGDIEFTRNSECAIHYGFHYGFLTHKDIKIKYSSDDMNRIKRVLEGKLRNLGLKEFTVKIEQVEDKEIVKFGLFNRPKYSYFSAYVIWVECSW